MTTGEDRQADLEKIAMALTDAPGVAGFGRLAEAHRSMGNPAEALRIAEAGVAVSPRDAEGRIALALALFDLDRAEQGREALEGLFGESAALAAALPMAMELPEDLEEPVADSELELAFAQAESDREEMFDVNRVAQEAMRLQELDEPEADLFSPEDHPAFATETMAGLLERQGDVAGAESIRSTLDGGSSAASGITDAAEVLNAVPHVPSDASDGADAARSARIVATLERWLQNLQRGVA